MQFIEQEEVRRGKQAEDPSSKVWVALGKSFLLSGPSLLSDCRHRHSYSLRSTPALMWVWEGSWCKWGKPVRAVSLVMLILSDSADCSAPGSSVHRILQARILEWVAMSSKGIFLTQGSNLCLLHLLPWQAGSLPLINTSCYYRFIW